MIPSQGFNPLDRTTEDESEYQGRREIVLLKWIWQLVKHSWAYRETNDEFVLQVSNLLFYLLVRNLC